LEKIYIFETMVDGKYFKHDFVINFAKPERDLWLIQFKLEVKEFENPLKRGERPRRYGHFV
jgi:hypothetical protein